MLYQLSYVGTRLPKRGWGRFDKQRPNKSRPYVPSVLRNDQDQRPPCLPLCFSPMTNRALALVVVLGMMAIGIAGCGGGGEKGAADVNKTLQGVPQKGATLGSPKAPVTITEFTDLRCVACKRFSEETLPDLIKQYVRPGKAKMELVLLKFLGADSDTAGRAGLAAANQNRLWNFAGLFYKSQGKQNTTYVNAKFLGKIARRVPTLDLKRWQKERTDERFNSELILNNLRANDEGIDTAPAFVIEGPGGKKKALKDAPGIDTFRSVIDDLLRRA